MQETITAYLFVLPWIVGFLLFVGGPIVASFALSFFKWKVIAPAQFLGLDNYISMFSVDDLFRKSLGITFRFSFYSVLLSQVLSLSLALLLNQPIRGLGVWRTVFYLPAVVSGVAGSVLWYWMYHGEFGIINNLLLAAGLEGRNWLWDKELVLGSLIVKSLWNVGVPMVIYMAAPAGVAPGSVRSRRPGSCRGMDQVCPYHPAPDFARHFLQCGHGHHLADSDLRRALRHDRRGDRTTPPCFWACTCIRTLFTF